MMAPWVWEGNWCDTTCRLEILSLGVLQVMVPRACG